MRRTLAIAAMVVLLVVLGVTPALAERGRPAGPPANANAPTDPRPSDPGDDAPQPQPPQQGADVQTAEIPDQSADDDDDDDREGPPPWAPAVGRQSAPGQQPSNGDDVDDDDREAGTDPAEAPMPPPDVTLPPPAEQGMARARANRAAAGGVDQEVLPLVPRGEENDDEDDEDDDGPPPFVRQLRQQLMKRWQERHMERFGEENGDAVRNGRGPRFARGAKPFMLLGTVVSLDGDSLEVEVQHGNRLVRDLLLDDEDGSLSLATGGVTIHVVVQDTDESFWFTDWAEAQEFLETFLVEGAEEDLVVRVFGFMRGEELIVRRIMVVVPEDDTETTEP